MKEKYVLAIHGGAGTIRKSSLTSEKEEAYRKALDLALQAGNKILRKGGDSLTAVEKAVAVMEDSDLFNAGRGSVFTSEGTHEMEASIMCGKTLRAGAVACVKRVKNPIILTRHILDDPDYVYLSGEGAQEYARLKNLEIVDEEYFFSEYRYNQWQSLQGTDSVALDHSGDKKFGTVGAVALDQKGHLAAATSTGGLTNKKYGRIGDSSIIGAGVYANDKTCAISCTGYGEYFIRGVVAYDISCLMEYQGLSLQKAAEIVIMGKQKKLGGEGGIIGVDRQGQVSLTFNSEGMYRGFISNDNLPHIDIYQ
jgi:beta-aspartyl-peptidase (threonine type)